MLARTGNRLLGGLGRNELAHRVVSVDDRDRAAVDDDFGRRGCIASAGAQTRRVPRQAQHAVRAMTPQIGLHQGVGAEMRALAREACFLVSRRCKIQEPLWIDLLGRHTAGYSLAISFANSSASTLPPESTPTATLPRRSSLPA